MPLTTPFLFWLPARRDDEPSGRRKRKKEKEKEKKKFLIISMSILPGWLFFSEWKDAEKERNEKRKKEGHPSVSKKRKRKK